MLRDIYEQGEGPWAAKSQQQSSAAHQQDPGQQPARQESVTIQPLASVDAADPVKAGTCGNDLGGLGGQIRAVFELFDSDGSGTVDESELAAAMIALGLSATGDSGSGRGMSEREAVRRLLDSVDKDHSQSMDLEEFSGLMQVPSD